MHFRPRFSQRFLYKQKIRTYFCPHSVPERLSTRVALEGLDARVGGSVLVEHSLLGECLAADAALEGSLLAVHASVHVQATGVRVRLTAHSTLKIILHGTR